MKKKELNATQVVIRYLKDNGLYTASMLKTLRCYINQCNRVSKVFKEDYGDSKDDLVAVILRRHRCRLYDFMNCCHNMGYFVNLKFPKKFKERYDIISSFRNYIRKYVKSNYLKYYCYLNLPEAYGHHNLTFTFKEVK